MEQTIDINRFSSIVANSQRSGLSDRYSFIPTTRLIERLLSHGWIVKSAMEVKTKVAYRVGFQKHLIRFQNPDLGTINDDLDVAYPEIVATNAHDGLNKFELFQGILRAICANGMIAWDAMFGSMKITHVGYTDEKVDLAVNHAVENIPKLVSVVKEWKGIELNPDEAEAFGRASLVARYQDEKDRLDKMNVPALLKPIRNADRDSNLWNTFNRVQEKLVARGGRFEVNKDRGWINNKVRPIKAISENVRVNKALWELASAMADIKTGRKSVDEVLQSA